MLPGDCARHSKGEFLARSGQRGTGARRPAPRNQRRVRHGTDVIAVLAAAVRDIETVVQRGRVTPAARTKFQAVAVLLRQERARLQADPAGTGSPRAEQLKRLNGIATILATTAVRDAGLLALLAEDAVVSDAARSLVQDPDAWADLGSPAECLQWLKQLWHVLVIAGHPAEPAS